MTRPPERPAAALRALTLLLCAGCFRMGYELPELAELPAQPDATAAVPPGSTSELSEATVPRQGSPSDAGAGGAAAALPDAAADPSDATAPAPAPPGTDCAWEAPELLVMSGVSGAQLFGGPHLSPDALKLYFSMQLSGSSEDLFVATRSSRADDFGAPVALAEVNSTSADGAPFVTADDATIYFFSQRGGTLPAARDLYVATRGAPGAAFSAPALVPGVNSAVLDQSPFLSADGLELWFGSHRGNTGFEDLYVARRASTSDGFGTPSAANELNSAGRDTGAALSLDGLSIYYSSERSGTEGGFDLWRAKRASRGAPFTTIEALRELNGSSDEFDPTLSGDEQEMIFVSNRGGSTRLWRATRACD